MAKVMKDIKFIDYSSLQKLSETPVKELSVSKQLLFLVPSKNIAIAVILSQLMNRAKTAATLTLSMPGVGRGLSKPPLHVFINAFRGC